MILHPIFRHTKTIEAYERILADRVGDQAAFLTALAAVKAARVQYESVPTAVYALGTFGVQAGRIIVVDAFGSVQHAVTVPSALNGTWHAFVGVEAGTHVALFAFHESIVPVPLPALRDLIKQRAWMEVGSVHIDTATCAIADEEGHAPLQVEEEGYRLAGVKSGLCFSNTANADGGYPVFTYRGLLQSVRQSPAPPAVIKVMIPAAPTRLGFWPGLAPCHSAHMRSISQ